jgi:hypothetical protein
VVQHIGICEELLRAHTGLDHEHGEETQRRRIDPA